MSEPGRYGYAKVLVSAPLVVSALVDGLRAAQPLAPLPKDAMLEAVAFDALKGIVTLTLSSKEWPHGLSEAPELPVAFRTLSKAAG